MAKSLGYAEQITWETIQNPYIPDGMLVQYQAQAKRQNDLDAVLEKMANSSPANAEQNQHSRKKR